ncbi:hypothetical protein [Butyrivibrio sp. WCE2006]|uniref:hypothetical protein n=1 Tax=Butyrivibrio sp. WCE2006 TaxID=1410611 RepID=UPI0005D161FC|nr:hypothetical protein [Butyrivibrio sp. WCE2006]
MKDNRYANIIVCYGDADRDILTKQIKMYKERYQSKVVLVMESEADTKWLDKHSEIFEETMNRTEGVSLQDDIVSYCKAHHLSEKETMLIAEFGDTEPLTGLGFEVKSPGAMAESYKKALEMLGNMIKPRV